MIKATKENLKDHQMTTVDEYKAYELQMRESLKVGDFISVRMLENRSEALLLVLARLEYGFKLLVCANNGIHWVENVGLIEYLSISANGENYRYAKL